MTNGVHVELRSCPKFPKKQWDAVTKMGEAKTGNVHVHTEKK